MFFVHAVGDHGCYLSFSTSVAFEQMRNAILNLALSPGDNNLALHVA
jgi:hypothetical protein